MMTIALGRVAAPPEHESTTATFYFWVDRDHAVERTQIVRTCSRIGNREVKFIGVVQEVYRRSRQRDIGEESARFDSRVAENPPFESEGVTYAEVAILRTEPVAHCPPTEESEVFLGSPEDAQLGYGVDPTRPDRWLPVGRLRNGGELFAGTAAIDTDFLLGKNGGHLNVNGIAGLGTKSTLLLIVNWLLLQEAARQQQKAPSGDGKLQVVPVIFNVKNFDLFHIDRWNRDFRAKEADHRSDWTAVGIDDPKPFEGVQFFAPQHKENTNPVPTGGRYTGVKAYSWSLADVIEKRLFQYLFADSDLGTANLGGLVTEVEEFLTGGTPDNPKLRTGEEIPQTFQSLLEWFKKKKEDKSFFGDFAPGTKGSFLRRLKFILRKSEGILRKEEQNGSPLKIPESPQKSPLVIDLNGVRAASLQRFVVAAVFQQISDTQEKKQVPNLKYLITLDELNRFAPKGSSDAITELIETVAAEGRSQGIILLGAQQQASLVSTRVIENAAVRAVGRSGTLELGADVWKFLGKSARDAAAQLQPDEKLLYQPSFREPMLAKIPFPPFALSENDVAADPPVPGRESPANEQTEW